MRLKAKTSRIGPILLSLAMSVYLWLLSAYAITDLSLRKLMMTAATTSFWVAIALVICWIIYAGVEKICKAE
jgi:uncharacterized protein with PQ loop repeat